MIDYMKFVESRTKAGTDIFYGLDFSKAELIHASMGVSGEAGELLDAIKKHVMYGKPLDVENVAEEIGDIMFYVTMMINTLNSYYGTNLSIGLCIERNIEKLTKRYPTTYTDADAIARADKVSE